MTIYLIWSECASANNSSRVTTHYSAAELRRLIEAADGFPKRTSADLNSLFCAVVYKVTHAKITQALPVLP